MATIENNNAGSAILVFFSTIAIWLRCVDPTRPYKKTNIASAQKNHQTHFFILFIKQGFSDWEQYIEMILRGYFGSKQAANEETESALRSLLFMEDCLGRGKSWPRVRQCYSQNCISSTEERPCLLLWWLLPSCWDWGVWRSSCAQKHILGSHRRWRRAGAGG